ncbi:b3220ceb-e7f0-4d81-9449-b4e88d3d3c8a [Thermothielavioides terrestris]|uniref:B3220ceb-e7f0-4d81-9449-b4e88d3d3c8a n=1 Tax=Thermothielavioides terrestris TaxID=2587410 RepID=A0A446BUF5_9PEZI|nr:b3220ceb-e7f0-4d81-9449-b4e88d3d3c8a [Thermothielavioides terrestris]
MSSSLDII